MLTSSPSPSSTSSRPRSPIAQRSSSYTTTTSSSSHPAPSPIPPSTTPTAANSSSSTTTTTAVTQAPASSNNVAAGAAASSNVPRSQATHLSSPRPGSLTLTQPQPHQHQPNQSHQSQTRSHQPFSTSTSPAHLTSRPAPASRPGVRYADHGTQWSPSDWSTSESSLHPIASARQGQPVRSTVAPLASSSGRFPTSATSHSTTQTSTTFDRPRSSESSTILASTNTPYSTSRQAATKLSEHTAPLSNASSAAKKPQADSHSDTASNKSSKSTTAALSKLAVADLARPEQPEPSEPRLRVTPQSSLQNAGTSTTPSTRRSHSFVSDSSADATATASDTGGAVSKLTPSSHKKAKQSHDEAVKKVMPADYSKCDPKELAVLISDMLMELIQFNDEIPLRDGHLTRFHSRAPPGISVRDYLQRLTFHATLPPPILLAMVFYIDRLCACYPQFTINSLTVHRFLITAATVASKGLSDSFWTNNTYARVGGVSIKELALLELELLSRMEWRIVPQPEMLVDYYRSLVARSADHRIDDSRLSGDAASDGSGPSSSSLASVSDDTAMSGAG